ncbi:uncharacterized protein LOC124911838 [Impatiens glandulifera]|uniref:uncharacterized protein LOC124911838 n=1 Tax=Impatiens glandulifera TaxID=253017 RepID=UPI001FB0E97A|nr:uncharacterized protein LOC124911838 [Impatiens glandulifera]
MSSSTSPSSSTHRRRSSRSSTNDPLSSPAANGSSYTGPAPSIVWQLLALCFVLSLAFLQFLPATHFRDPFDPLRKWVPYQSNISTSIDTSKGTSINIVSWMDCINIQVFTVLINSTLSSTNCSDLVSFHFFVPENQKDDKVLYYKLKVLFPDVKLQFIGQEMVKRQIMSAYGSDNVEEYSRPSFAEMAPYVIPFLHIQLTKFVYLLPNLILKGNVDELVRLELNDYPIGVNEDCSKKMNTYVNYDILDAIQRSAAKPWVSRKPYSIDACMPLLSLVLIDSSRLEKDFVESILWWSKVLNEKQRRSNPHPAIALAIYNRYLKIPDYWRVGLLEYGKSSSFCSDNGKAINTMSDFASRFKQYLPLSSNQILDLHQRPQS